MKDARSGVHNENLQEIIDAAVSTGHALQGGQQQYQTPDWLARGLAALLPYGTHVSVLDPQCADGNLLMAINTSQRFGIELDRRKKEGELDEMRPEVNLITGSCVHVADLIEEFHSHMEFTCIVANPPFGIRWKLKDDTTIDSTEWTWAFIKKRLCNSGSGFLISNAKTLEKLLIPDDPMVYLYQRFPAGGVWENCDVELGIVHFVKSAYGPGGEKAQREVRVWDHVPTEEELATFARSRTMPYLYRPYCSSPQYGWSQLTAIVKEETLDRPKFNIYLNREGMLRTYLSTRAQIKMPQDEIRQLARINHCHPLTLTTEMETRKLMQSYLTSGVYTLEPAARKAIEAALAEVASLACPIRPVTDFELVAYADLEEHLRCRQVDANGKLVLTVGKLYEVRTGTYSFVDRFSRKKIYYDEETDKTELEDHECQLTGEDRYIEITDDNRRLHRFMDRPTQGCEGWQHPEAWLWELFERPLVLTVSEVNGPQYEQNKDTMAFNQLLAGFTYFPGQLDYCARMGCKDYGLVAADVGCHAKGTLIMMSDGRSKLVEDVVVGDKLMGWDNTPRRVLSLSRGRQGMVRIKPVKGEPFVVNLDHILTLVQTNMHSSQRRSQTNGVIRDVTVREYLTWTQTWKHTHKLFRRAIRLPHRRIYSFSPYFMGVYLGDGGSTTMQVSITKPDPEIRAAVDKECKSFGWTFRTSTKGDGNVTHHIHGGGARHELAKHGLLGLLSGQRFIPHLYKYNGKEERLELLAGLLDTDGHLNYAGTFDYISKSKQLAEDVTWVAQSLGLAAYITPCRKGCQTGVVGDYYRVSISGELDMIPSRIPRKQAKKRQQKKDVLRTGFTVEMLPEDDFYGFAIEGDGRFLMGDFTVTHNTGKSLMALTLIALKSPLRTLLIAPQGTMRSSGEEDDIEYQAAQWVQEIERFAPGEPVFQLFSREDWKAILHANAGELPPGVYITYPQAYFNNGAFETIPMTWSDRETEQRFCERFQLTYDEQRPLEDLFSRHVGTSNKHGIRCIAEPSLATLMGTSHGEWSLVVVDEAHLCCNLDANITQALLRLQPKFRFAMTATPIPNIVSNIFSLMGWLCVKDWYKGKRRNAAWPYSCDEIGRFNSTFLSTEVDLTAQRKARMQGKRRSQVGVKFSPIISSPARLLKLLKSNLAYISKEDCNPELKPCHVIDVRVAMGKEQSKLYAYWLERKNYLEEYKNPLTIAQVQSTRLRGVCAAPASLEYTRDMCKSNFNPKTVTILQLIRDCLAKGEPITVVSARVGQSQALATRLADAGIPLARIDSTVLAELHSAEAARFKKGDARVMLMGIKCAQGHSFEHCPNLIVGSLEWSYGSLHQAKGRVWRLTSRKDVTIWCVLHQNTIEELLFDRVAVKQDAATLCLHGMRVPRDFKTLDASEVLAEHIVNYKAEDGEILSESECESQWPELRKQLVMANRGVRAEDAA